MRQPPSVIRQFDEPVVSAARSIGLGGTNIYCQWQSSDVFTMPLVVPGTWEGETWELILPAPATVFMHAEFWGTLHMEPPTTHNYVEVTGHLNPGPPPEVGYEFSGPVTSDAWTVLDTNNFARGAFSWSGVCSYEAGTFSVQPVVNAFPLGNSFYSVDAEVFAISCYITLIISASTGDCCLEYAPPA